MAVGLVCALAAAVASGLAVVLQGVAARRDLAGPVGTGFLWRLVRDPVYLVGLALTALGFVLALAALRELPLFVVQAARASSLGVTAVASVAAFGTRLRGVEVASLAAVFAGLTLLGVSAQQSPPPSVPAAGRWSLLLVLAVLALGVALVARSGDGAGSGYGLGVLAGCSFATLGVAARLLRDPTDALSLVADPAAWALAGSGLLALATFALAVRRASVTGVTATMVATETLVASSVGLLLGDAPAPGRWPMAALGFAVTLAGALGMARAATAAPGSAGAPVVGPPVAAAEEDVSRRTP